MKNGTIPLPFKQKISPLIDQMPGYFLWKDLNSRYLGGSISTARLFGFNHTDELIGNTDYDVQCEAANYANLFIKQDEKVKSTQSSMLVLDVHPYRNNEIKTLLTNKSLLIDESSNIIGVSCQCIELNNQILNDIACKLSQSNKNLTLNHRVKKAANYYIGSTYERSNLTERQSQCLFYLIRGKSTKTIAKILNLSPRTIESYIEQIKNKMSCESRAELIETAIENGFLEIVPREIIDVNLRCTLVVD